MIPFVYKSIAYDIICLHTLLRTKINIKDEITFVYNNTCRQMTSFLKFLFMHKSACMQSICRYYVCNADCVQYCHMCKNIFFS